MEESKETYQTKRLTIPAAEEILGKEFPVLDHGFVRLIDYMGGDEAISEAARRSYGKGTRSVREDSALIRFLMRHGHTSPFEMVELKFNAKMPIFVARQWVRHRTASLNELSLRYSNAENVFYIPTPESVKFQSTANKQGGSDETVPDEVVSRALEFINSTSEFSFDRYSKMSKDNIARELARIALPVNLYTEWYWKINLHNLFHFLDLRMAEDAQQQIRQYAKVMAGMVKRVAPISYQAFKDYVLDAVAITGPERTLVAGILQDLPESQLESIAAGLPTKREAKEFVDKIRKLREVRA